jgi:long-chain acyl-CoA synthetase
VTTATTTTGQLDRDGFLRIADRKKDALVTSSGKNVAGTDRERSAREPVDLPGRGLGDRRPYLAALLTVDADELPALAACPGSPATPPRWPRIPCLASRVAPSSASGSSRSTRASPASSTSGASRSCRASSDARAGELTPTLKVKRVVVTDRYAEEIARLYV